MNSKPCAKCGVFPSRAEHAYCTGRIVAATKVSRAKKLRGKLRANLRPDKRYKKDTIRAEHY